MAPPRRESPASSPLGRFSRSLGRASVRRCAVVAPLQPCRDPVSAAFLRLSAGRLSATCRSPLCGGRRAAAEVWGGLCLPGNRQPTRRHSSCAGAALSKRSPPRRPQIRVNELNKLQGGVLYPSGRHSWRPWGLGAAHSYREQIQIPTHLTIDSLYDM